VVALGNTFEDVAEALSEPVQPEPAPVPDPPVEKVPEPERAETPTSEALVASANPQRVTAPDTGSVNVVQPDTTGPTEPVEGAASEPETVEPAGGSEGTIADAAVAPPAGSDRVANTPEGDPEAITEPVEAVAAEPVASPPTAPASQRLAALPVPVPPALPVTPAPEPSAIPVIPLDPETVDPETPETTAEPTPDDPATAQAEDESGRSTMAVATSLRPRLPERRLSAETDGVRDGSKDLSDLRYPSQLIESPLDVYRREGIDILARGNSGARSDGRGFLNSRGPGNSDVTNYAGQVLVHLNRTPPVSVSGRGFARVFFQIDPDGTLAWVDIIDSSGSQEIDRAAKAQVRSAVPFPRPPQGVSRKLVFVYQIQ